MSTPTSCEVAPVEVLYQRQAQEAEEAAAEAVSEEVAEEAEEADEALPVVSASMLDEEAEEANEASCMQRMTPDTTTMGRPPARPEISSRIAIIQSRLQMADLDDAALSPPKASYDPLLDPSFDAPRSNSPGVPTMPATIVAASLQESVGLLGSTAQTLTIPSAQSSERSRSQNVWPSQSHEQNLENDPILQKVALYYVKC